MATWSAADVPDQRGRSILITGANSGIGLDSAVALAAKGARVLLACRNAERGAAAVRTVRAAARDGGTAELRMLDTADLASVRRCADEVTEPLDVLLNNAGVMATPRRTTVDGFELQLGTNHFGHAALTWLLLPRLLERPGARVVTVSSVAHRAGRFDVQDPNFEHRRYESWSAYAQSKLANLLFAFELDRRARAAGLDLVSVAAHPGLANTELTGNMMRSRGAKAVARVAGAVTGLVAQSSAQGALPQLHAATMPGVQGGQCWGPGGFRQLRGAPTVVRVSEAANDAALAAAVWDLTATITGVPARPA